MSAPDSSARLLLASLDHVPLAAVVVYVAQMYIESADKVRFMVGWYQADAPFEIYVSTAALRKASGHFARGTPRFAKANAPGEVSPYSIHFLQVDGQAAVVFGLWLGLQTAEYANVYDAFDDVIRFKFDAIPGLVLKCWEIAEQFDSQPFKNYLVTTTIQMCDNDIDALFGLTNRFARLGYDNSDIVGAMVENLAYLYVEHDLSFSDVLGDWMRHPHIMRCGPVLLNDFLNEVQDLAGLQTRLMPFHPLHRICWKWHKHQSMEERSACHDFDAGNDTVLGQSDHEDNADEGRNDEDDTLLGQSDYGDHGNEGNNGEDDDDDSESSDSDDDDESVDGDENADDGGRDVNGDHEDKQEEEAENGNPEPDSGLSGGDNKAPPPKYYNGWAQAAQEQLEALHRAQEAQGRKRTAAEAGLDGDEQIKDEEGEEEGQVRQRRG